MTLLERRRQQFFRSKMEEDMNYEDAYQEHIYNEGDSAANDHPDGCFYCGSSSHHSQDCQDRES